MLRRLAHLLLAAIFLLAATGACPRGGACPSMQQAAHKCCDTPAEAVRASDCCTDGSQLANRALGTERAGEPVLAVALAPVAPEGLPPATAVFAATTRARGLAPPGTLLAQHTSLLL